MQTAGIRKSSRHFTVNIIISFYHWKRELQELETLSVSCSESYGEFMLSWDIFQVSQRFRGCHWSLILELFLHKISILQSELCPREKLFRAIQKLACVQSFAIALFALWSPKRMILSKGSCFQINHGKSVRRYRHLSFLILNPFQCAWFWLIHYFTRR